MRYVIIGASAAGITAAKTIRKLDSEGEIVIISKDTAVYSRCMLHHLISGDRTEDRLKFIDEDLFDKDKISWRKGKEVISVLPDSKSVKTSDGEEYGYDRLLIATGSSPFLPPIEGLGRGRQVFTLKDLSDAQKIKEAANQYKNVVVIGGGLVGVDAAASLIRKGNRVTMIEMGGNILPLQLDTKSATKYETFFRKNGMDIFTSNSVSKIVLDESDNVKGIILKDGTEIEADMVVAAAGVRPNIVFIKDTCIKVDKGIVVDEHQKTSVDGIYAAGDVCQSYELFKQAHMLTPIWPVAMRQGETAAFNMAGKKRILTDNFAFKNSMRFFGLSTISYGMTNPPDDSYQVEICEGCDSYYKIIHKDGIICGAVIQGDISGAGVFGRLIQERIDVSGYLDRIFDLNYGYFFKEDDKGAFSFNK